VDDQGNGSERCTTDVHSGGNGRSTWLGLAQHRALPGLPEFEEYTVVLSGLLRVESKEGVIDVQAGQAVIAHAGEWVRYSTPTPAGAEYIAICCPAFSPDTVHRDT
jgi:mannose-6-phosphate isomerase-like protein (cupin superfamily)